LAGRSEIGQVYPLGWHVDVSLSNANRYGGDAVGNYPVRIHTTVVANQTSVDLASCCGYYMPQHGLFILTEGKSLALALAPSKL
jgi:hypothetical protein